MQERRRKFTPEFRDEAVKMVIETARPIAEIARDIHVNEGTLGNWVHKYRVEHVEEEPALSVSERARRRALEREDRELRMKTEFLGEAAAFLRPGVSVSSKYEFIDAEKARYPVVKMCEWMAVSTSGFYEWRGRPSSATNSRRAELRLLIGKVFADSDDTYGYRRVHAKLARLGVPVGPELVRAPSWSAERAPRVWLARSGGSSSANLSCLRASSETSGSAPARSAPKRSRARATALATAAGAAAPGSLT